MGHHGGPDTAGLVAGAAAEPTERGSQRHPPPIRKTAKPEVRQTEAGRGEAQGGGAVPGPIFNPLLEHAAKKELLTEGDDEEESQKRSGYIPKRFPGGPP